MTAFIRFLLGFSLVITALFLILLVLIQRGRGGGLAGAFGGAGGQSAFGTKAGDVFTKITVAVAGFWILLCILAINLLGRPTSLISEGLGGAAPPPGAPVAPGGGPATPPVNQPATPPDMQPATPETRPVEPETKPPATEPTTEPAAERPAPSAEPAPPAEPPK
jgi:preprotein translocase subunit SecG